MSLYKIELSGCDDYTSFIQEMTDEESDFLVKIAIKANETSTYRCMPTMSIYEIPKSEINKMKEIQENQFEWDEDTERDFYKFIADSYECEKLMDKII